MRWRELLEVAGFLLFLAGVAISPLPWVALLVAGVGLILKANEPERPRKEQQP